MKYHHFLLIFFSIFFSGCVTPVYHYNNVMHDFAPKDLNNSQSTKNGVIFSGFDIPQPKTRIERRDTPFRFVHLFDVTDQVEYIGTLPGDPFSGALFDVAFGTFLEYNAPVGRRTFMLVFEDVTLLSSNGLDKYHTDFIQVNISKDHLTHISVAYRYHESEFLSDASHNLIANGGLWPFFTEIKMDDKYFQSCTNIIGDRESRINQINEYMTSQSINLNQKYFKNYCGMLCSRFRDILSINENANQEFEKNKNIFINLKEERLPRWQKTIRRNSIFPLIRSN